MLIAALAALTSAALSALANVLHHRAGIVHGGLRVTLSPVWLLGTVVSTSGLVLHVVALQRGQLSVVQPLLVSGLLFALPLAALFDRRRLVLAQAGWAGLVVVGLALFLVSAQPAAGRPVANTVHLALIGGLIAAIATAAVLTGVVRPHHRAALWALAGGCGYGLVAVLLKQCLGQVSLGASELLGSWELYALPLVGLTAVAINQAAFNAGPLASSLPVLTITDPVVAIVAGAILFGEETASTPILVAAQLVGFLTMTVAVVAVTRSSVPGTLLPQPG